MARTTYVDQSQTIDSSADHIIRSEDSQDIASEPTTTIVDDFDTDPDGGTDALQPPDPVETDLESM